MQRLRYTIGNAEVGAGVDLCVDEEKEVEDDVDDEDIADTIYEFYGVYDEHSDSDNDYFSE